MTNHQRDKWRQSSTETSAGGPQPPRMNCVLVATHQYRTMKAFFSSLIPSYIDYWKRAFDFKGKTSRTNYWSAFLMEVLIFVIIFILLFLSKWDLLSQLPSDSQPSSDEMTEIIKGTWQITAWQAINIIPAFSILVRRVRDAGAKFWVIALSLSSPISVFLGISSFDLDPSLIALGSILSFVGLVPFAYAFAPSSGSTPGRKLVK